MVVMLKIAVGLIAVPAVLLAATECVLRMFQKKAPVRKRYIRLKESPVNLDFTVPLSEKLLGYTENLNKTCVRLRTDANGFTEPSLIHEDPDRVIVFLGGSTMRCAFVDEENRYPYRVGRLLEEQTGLKINAINNGVDASNLMHSVNMLLNKILPFDPDIVVLHQNVNDVVTLMLLGTYWNDHFRRSLIVEQKPLSAMQLAMSLRYGLLRHTFDWLLSVPLFGRATNFFHFRHMREFRHLRGRRVVLDEPSIVRMYAGALRTFTAVCRAWGIRPVLVTESSRFADEPDAALLKWTRDLTEDLGISYREYKRLHGRFNDVIREEATAQDVLLVDLDREIPRTSETMYDLFHYNDPGSLRAAEAIAGVLLPVVRSHQARSAAPTGSCYAV